MDTSLAQACSKVNEFELSHAHIKSWLIYLYRLLHSYSAYKSLCPSADEEYGGKLRLASYEVVPRISQLLSNYRALWSWQVSNNWNAVAIRFVSSTPYVVYSGCSVDIHQALLYRHNTADRVKRWSKGAPADSSLDFLARPAKLELSGVVCRNKNLNWARGRTVARENRITSTSPVYTSEPFECPLYEHDAPRLSGCRCVTIGGNS